ncbi:uncharacterized protein BCR38DRAFT_421545 [Pseudomassariella vexata]|uniref:Chromo domain-containing protein n=1 Tax=Pseudomassariella vexata TaxID=1141098 RepID=A0A1Y2EG68_9PEZI|nr:uncharacterized protein BCR38DRAFT_421545 [Pseudomassariella vexata]ORY70256.1 hypothetical protein BCR38DRAFT_421545 [Pseudomassariella vexata]
MQSSSRVPTGRLGDGFNPGKVGRKESRRRDDRESLQNNGSTREAGNKPLRTGTNASTISQSRPMEQSDAHSSDAGRSRDAANSTDTVEHDQDPSQYRQPGSRVPTGRLGDDLNPGKLGRKESRRLGQDGRYERGSLDAGTTLGSLPNTESERGLDSETGAEGGSSLAELSESSPIGNPTDDSAPSPLPASSPSQTRPDTPRSYGVRHNARGQGLDLGLVPEPLNTGSQGTRTSSRDHGPISLDDKTSSQIQKNARASKLSGQSLKSTASLDRKYGKHIVDVIRTKTKAGATAIKYLVSYQGLEPDQDEWLTPTQLGDDFADLLKAFYQRSRPGSESSDTDGVGSYLLLPRPSRDGRASHGGSFDIHNAVSAPEGAASLRPHHRAKGTRGEETIVPTRQAHHEQIRVPTAVSMSRRPSESTQASRGGNMPHDNDNHSIGRATGRKQPKVHRMLPVGIMTPPANPNSKQQHPRPIRAIPSVGYIGTSREAPADHQCPWRDQYASELWNLQQHQQPSGGGAYPLYGHGRRMSHNYVQYGHTPALVDPSYALDSRYAAANLAPVTTGLPQILVGAPGPGLQQTPDSWIHQQQHYCAGHEVLDGAMLVPRHGIPYPYPHMDSPHRVDANAAGTALQTTGLWVPDTASLSQSQQQQQQVETDSFVSGRASTHQHQQQGKDDEEDRGMEVGLPQVQGLTIVMHVRGKEDVVVNTDLSQGITSGQGTLEDHNTLDSTTE